MRTTYQLTATESDATSWTRDWKLVRSLESGNQGTRARDRRRLWSTRIRQRASKHAPAERRARFLREVGILGALNMPGVPQRLDSNAAHADDGAYELFLATEFVDGLRLRT
jgi:hypothetical protein